MLVLIEYYTLAIMLFLKRDYRHYSYSYSHPKKQNKKHLWYILIGFVAVGAQTVKFYSLFVYDIYFCNV